MSNHDDNRNITVGDEKPIDIVMRSHNDMASLPETLNAIARQDYPCRLFVLDNQSTDGSRELVEQHAERVVHVPRGTYIPGRVLNRGMQITESEIVVFINADCLPCDTRWLRELVEVMQKEKCAAVFGRQVPRPGCHPLYAKDTEDTFGDGHLQARWKHCFSMASSAIRRSVWNEMRFDEEIQYSEDIDWTWRAVQAGHAVRYVAESRVFHSHNYTLGQAYRRQFGEGEAEAFIFDWPLRNRRLLRYTIAPLLRRILSDWRFCLRHGYVRSLLFSPVLRTVQAIGRRQGFRRGLRSRKRRDASLRKGMPVS